MTIPIGRRARDLTWLVALGAGLWGTDAFFRANLATASAPTVVFVEHLMLVVILAPFLPRSFRAFARSDARTRAAVLGIGIGASAVATTLFTLAFQQSGKHYDFVTPVVIQHLQPLFAIGGAVLLLGERIRARFTVFAVPALIGVWLLAFARPFHITMSGLNVILLALGAAVLWAAGTVLGRLVSASIAPLELTTLRFAIGLPTAAVIVLFSGDQWWVPDLPSTASVVGLVLIPSLLALVLYYIGLRRTAASRATLAELAFPLVGAVVGIWVGSPHRPLTASQWFGAAVIVVAVTALSFHEVRARTQAVLAPQPSESESVLS